MQAISSACVAPWTCRRPIFVLCFAPESAILTGRAVIQSRPKTGQAIPADRQGGSILTANHFQYCSGVSLDANVSFRDGFAT